MAKQIKIFFVTDIHGSNHCYRKFLNALKAYNVDVGILLGDLTGKVMIPLIEKADGGITWIEFQSPDGDSFNCDGYGCDEPEPPTPPFQSTDEDSVFVFEKDIVRSDMVTQTLPSRRELPSGPPSVAPQDGSLHVDALLKAGNQRLHDLDRQEQRPAHHLQQAFAQSGRVHRDHGRVGQRAADLNGDGHQAAAEKVAQQGNGADDAVERLERRDHDEELQRLIDQVDLAAGPQPEAGAIESPAVDEKLAV